MTQREFSMRSHVGKPRPLRGTDPDPETSERGPMLREAFCTRCTRMLYMSEGDGDHCPVCSTPLLVTSDPSA